MGQDRLSGPDPGSFGAGRATGITVADTARPLARRIGNLLARAKRLSFGK